MRNRFSSFSFSFRTKFLVFLLLLSHISYFTSYSQTSNSSPYSRYGLGDLQSGGFANMAGMGGISQAFQNDSLPIFFINPNNPAANAHYRLTVFDIGVMDQFTQLQTEGAKYNANRAALSYLAFAFPIVKNKWGASFGVMPFSNIGYKINTSGAVDSSGTAYYAYEGAGGLNEIYLGNGFKFKNFSAGINVSYLFGGLTEISRDSFPDLNNTFSTKVTETKQFSDLYLKGGLQYKAQLSKSWSAVLGLTASLQTDLNAKNTYLAETYKYRFGLDQIRDTIRYSPNIKDTVTLPGMYGLGFALRRSDKLLITADIMTQNWSSFDKYGQKGLLGNSNRISAGFQYWPGRNVIKGAYYKKMAYRAGFKYANTYLLLNNNEPLTDMSVSFGFGLPLRVTKVGENYNWAILNLGFELGQRGTTQNNLIKENYVRVTLGFSINERWFIAHPYN